MVYKKIKQLFNNLYQSSKTYLFNKKDDELPYLEEYSEDTLENLINQDECDKLVTLCKGHFDFDEFYLKDYELILDSTILLKRKKKYIH